MLALLLAAAPAAAAEAGAEKAVAAAKARLEGCERAPITGGTRFECALPDDGRMVLSAIDLSHATMPMAREGLRQQLVDFSNGGGTVTPVKLKHGAKQLEGSTIAMPNAFTTWLVFEGPVGPPRMVSCTAPSKALEAKHCTPLHHFFADVDGAYFANAPVKPTFDGKDKAVPVSCKVSGTERAYQVMCGNNAVFGASRHESAESAKDYEEKMMALLLKSLPGSAPGPSEPCVVGGATTTCRLITHAEVTLRSAIVELNGQHLAVSCTQPPKYPGFHRVCSDVFQAPKK
jgi:hypothetical protein